jgi:hypothetical protein
MTNETTHAAPDLAVIMHTLGQIARAVWPKGRMPMAIQINLLARPDRGFDLMVKHDEFKDGDIDRITQLLDKVPATFTVPPEGVTEEHERSFWVGFDVDPNDTPGDVDDGHQ